MAIFSAMIPASLRQKKRIICVSVVLSLIQYSKARIGAASTTKNVRQAQAASYSGDYRMLAALVGQQTTRTGLADEDEVHSAYFPPSLSYCPAGNIPEFSVYSSYFPAFHAQLYSNQLAGERLQRHQCPECF
jgi:hypothetical protein